MDSMNSIIDIKALGHYYNAKDQACQTGDKMNANCMALRPASSCLDVRCLFTADDTVDDVADEIADELIPLICGNDVVAGCVRNN